VLAVTSERHTLRLPRPTLSREPWQPLVSPPRDRDSSPVSPSRQPERAVRCIPNMHSLRALRLTAFVMSWARVKGEPRQMNAERRAYVEQLLSLANRARPTAANTRARRVFVEAVVRLSKGLDASTSSSATGMEAFRDLIMQPGRTEAILRVVAGAQALRRRALSPDQRRASSSSSCSTLSPRLGSMDPDVRLRFR
jgi:hypothetical protein